MSGCVDAVCARPCLWAAGTTDEPGELRREPGAGASGAACRGEGRPAWPEEADWAGVWAGTSHLGLRGAMGSRYVCSWVLCLFLCDWVSRFVCSNVCLHFHVSMYAHGNVCMSMCARVHSCLWPRLSTSMFNCRHIYVAPTSVSCVLPMFVSVSEFGLVPKRFQGARLDL